MLRKFCAWRAMSWEITQEDTYAAFERRGPQFAESAPTAVVQGETQDAGKQKHHDLVLRVAQQPSQHAHNEVNIGNTNADAGEGDAANSDRMQDHSVSAWKRQEQ